MINKDSVSTQYYKDDKDIYDNIDLFIKMLKDCYDIKLNALSYLLGCDNIAVVETEDLTVNKLLLDYNEILDKYNKKIVGSILKMSPEEFKKEIGSFIENYNNNINKKTSQSTKENDRVTNDKVSNDKYINVNYKKVNIKNKNLNYEQTKNKLELFEKLNSINKNKKNIEYTAPENKTNDEEIKVGYEESKNNNIDSFFYDVVIITAQSARPDIENKIEYIYNVIQNIMDNLFQEMNIYKEDTLYDMWEIYTQSNKYINNTRNNEFNKLSAILEKYIPKQMTTNHIYLLNKTIKRVYINVTKDIKIKIKNTIDEINADGFLKLFTQKILQIRILDFLNKNEYLMRDFDENMDICCVCLGFSGNTKNIMTTIFADKSFHKCGHKNQCINCFLKGSWKEKTCPKCRAYQVHDINQIVKEAKNKLEMAEEKDFKSDIYIYNNDTGKKIDTIKKTINNNNVNNVNNNVNNNINNINNVNNNIMNRIPLVDRLIELGIPINNVDHIDDT